MTKSIWEFSKEEKEEKTPFDFLVEYAGQLLEATDEIISGDVTRTYNDDNTGLIYTLYLVVPEMRYYSYKLIEVIQKDLVNVYPVDMILFGSAKQNRPKYENVYSNQFESRLREFISSSMTKNILSGLKIQLEIVRKYEGDRM
ncbi:Rossmann-fold NAD(P)-binding domain-containing protein [Pedobacter cryotolerans]|uniref:Uncharacterized protein n=1 Tax=Pedobacter cryotolerans TaxID=2571270 RepID=A0A4U1C5Y6_9SPHI|nr:hypothetical protein [Pedobacter cryotolerans]TKC01408.1 hypothetical protein FA045_09230 [Pedobacter cryotolerans]